MRINLIPLPRSAFIRLYRDNFTLQIPSEFSFAGNYKRSHKLRSNVQSNSADANQDKIEARPWTQPSEINSNSHTGELRSHASGFGGFVCTDLQEIRDYAFKGPKTSRGPRLLQFMHMGLSFDTGIQVIKNGSLTVTHFIL